jgi:DNA-binding transcriptional MerR regulator
MAGDIPIYNLKAVIHETGLTPATLRAWERRYGLLHPQRTAGGHRLYTEDDIRMLKWLVARQDEGLSISRAIQMWRSLEAGESVINPALAPQPILGTGGLALDDLRRAWVSACMAFDESAAEQALAQSFAIASPEVVSVEILQKGLSEIGEGWYQGSVSVQQEHFASALAMRRLNTLFVAAGSPTRPQRILAACPSGEQHEFILLLLSYLLRRRGWEAVYLGANVPLDRLDTAVQSIAPRLILSVAQTLNSAAALRDMALFANQQHIPFAYGGSIFIGIPELIERIPGHYLGGELSLAPQLVEHLLTHPAPPLPASPNMTTYPQLLENFYAKEGLILATMNDLLSPIQLNPAHLEEANHQFNRNIASALTLGNMHFLDHSVGWLHRLLANYGLSPSLAMAYYHAYGQAVAQHLGSDAAPILEWLSEAESEVSHA